MHEHAWLRLLPLWYGIFYVMLLSTTIFVLMEVFYLPESSIPIAGFTVLLGIWYGFCMTPLSQRLRQHPLLAMGYLVIGWSVWFWLSLLDSRYMFLLFGLYPQVFFFRPMPWKIFDAIILTIFSLGLQVLLLKGFDGSLLITIAATICGILMTFFIEAIIRQSRERHRLLRELEVTRHDLAIAERQAGVTEERQRLAHEIHDTLVQGFTSIVMHLEAAEEALSSDQTTLQRHLDQARHTARENLVEARHMMWALQPKVLNSATLPDVLTYLSRDWSEEHGVVARTTITGDVCALRPEIEVTLLRAAQEALTNAGKYAQACQVVVTLSYMEDTVVLDVQDDGRGFDTAQLLTTTVGPTVSGFGLKALHERVEQLGGTLSIESIPEEGTTIAVALPAASNELFLHSKAIGEVRQ